MPPLSRWAKIVMELSAARERAERERELARRAADLAAYPENCDQCHLVIGGSGGARCRCFDPLRPGASPLALEARNEHPSGVSTAVKLAVASFSNLELATVRNAMVRNPVAMNGGTSWLLMDGAIDGTRIFSLLRSVDAARAVGARAVALQIRSEGGSVTAGLALVRAIERLRKAGVPTIAAITGFANSMASVIAVECDYAIIAPAATMQIHEVSGGHPEHLAILRAKLLDVYARRTLLDREKLAGYLAGDVTLNAFQAHSFGFVDEVAEPARMQEVVRAAADGLFAGPIRSANSWRRTVLREREADASGVVRFR